MPTRSAAKRAASRSAWAPGEGFGRVVAHDFGQARRSHRSERCRLIARIAKNIMGREIGESADELVIERFVHIDSLDPAAALARIIEGAVDEIFDRVIEIRVRPDIGRVLAAEFEPDAGEGPGGGALDRRSASTDPVKADVVEPSRGDERGRRSWSSVRV